VDEMNIGTVKTGKGNKKLNICIIGNRRASRDNFDAALSALSGNEFIKNNVTDETDSKTPGKRVMDILKSKGRVYGVYQDNELVGIYIYERIEDFFVKVENEDSDKKAGTRFQINNIKEFFKMTDDDVVDFEDWFFGESKAIYRLVSHYLLALAEEYKDEIEKYIAADLKEQIEWGQIAGVLQDEKLTYRRNLDNNERVAYGNTLGYGAGFAIGVGFGWLVFDSISMGLLWGVCYAAIGGLIFTNATTKKEWTTFDFVNKKYVGAEEDK
jgi:hypothetical protein